MGKVAFITNIPSPYRVDLFYYIQTMIKRHELHVIYTSEREGNRLWNIAEDKLLNSYILHSKVIELKGMIDKRFVHLPVNVGKKLHEVKPDVVIAMEYNPAALQALWWCRRWNLVLRAQHRKNTESNEKNNYKKLRCGNCEQYKGEREAACLGSSRREDIC